MNGGMAVMADQGDGAWGTAGGATRSVGLAIGTNGVVVYQHSSNVFSSLLTYSGTIQTDSDIAVVFVNKTPTLYINGVQVATGIQSDGTTVRASVGNNSLNGIGGGNAVGGRYFNGTLSDYRVWNSALDATTINNNRTTAIATGAPGLLANMIATSINESATNGTVVGRARGYDPDAGATFGYTLTNDAGGRFTINNSTGEITVLNSSLLDFETANSHTITVRTTDQGGLTYDENVYNPIAGRQRRSVLDNTGTMTLTSITEYKRRPVVKPSHRSLLPPVAIASLMLIAVPSRASRLPPPQTATELGNTRPTRVALGQRRNGIGQLRTPSSIDDLLRFVPNGSGADSGDITFRGWDQSGSTAGQHGTKVNTSPNGGSTAFSLATETASIHGQRCRLGKRHQRAELAVGNRRYKTSSSRRAMGTPSPSPMQTEQRSASPLLDQRRSHLIEPHRIDLHCWRWYVRRDDDL